MTETLIEETHTRLQPGEEVSLHDLSYYSGLERACYEAAGYAPPLPANPCQTCGREQVGETGRTTCGSCLHNVNMILLAQQRPLKVKLQRELERRSKWRSV